MRRLFTLREPPPPLVKRSVGFARRRRRGARVVDPDARRHARDAHRLAGACCRARARCCAAFRRCSRSGRSSPARRPRSPRDHRLRARDHRRRAVRHPGRRLSHLRRAHRADLGLPAQHPGRGADSAHDPLVRDRRDAEDDVHLHRDGAVRVLRRRARRRRRSRPVRGDGADVGCDAAARSS